MKRKKVTGIIPEVFLNIFPCSANAASLDRQVRNPLAELLCRMKKSEKK